MIRVSASDGQNAGVMELNAVSEADAVANLSGCSSGYGDGAPFT
jgi:hypothetical protein